MTPGQAARFTGPPGNVVLLLRIPAGRLRRDGPGRPPPPAGPRYRVVPHPVPQAVPVIQERSVNEFHGL